MIDLIYEINLDLKIRKLEGEEDIFHKARIVYSVLSFWIRAATLDDDKGVSPKYISSRCSKILENVMESCPEIKGWFFTNKNNINCPIIKIRKRLIAASEIKYLGFKNKLMVSKYKDLKLKEGKIIRGYCENKGLTISGLGYFKDIKCISDNELDSILKFYYIDKISGKESFINKIKNINWERRKKSNIEIFNSKAITSLSKAFDSNYKLDEGEISIYRHGNSIYDYGFIKKQDGKYYFAIINDYEIKENEVRRYQYAIRNIHGNTEIARYEFMKESNLYKLKLFSRLPKKEESVLLLLGWPSKNIDDFCNLIFPGEIWKLVESIIKNLSINLVKK